MKESTIMYWLKPVFEIPQELSLPSCMYKVKNPVACVTNTRDHTDDEKEILAGVMEKKPVTELAFLELRWDSVIQQLSELKSEMETIRKSVTESCKLSGYTLVDNATLHKITMMQGAVINASPSNPPYFLLLVKHLYKTSLPISICSHIHSTVLSLPDEVKSFSSLTSESDSALKLLLIWKEGITDTELVTNPVKQLSIKGDVNILRFFAQSGLKLLGYPSELLFDTIQTDTVLDICHRLLHTKMSKEKSSLLRSLNAKLGKCPYFGGSGINISDISAWSALKQINVSPAKDLSQTMAKWYERLDQLLL